MKPTPTIIVSLFKLKEKIQRKTHKSKVQYCKNLVELVKLFIFIKCKLPRLEHFPNIGRLKHFPKYKMQCKMQSAKVFTSILFLSNLIQILIYFQERMLPRDTKIDN